MIVGAKTPDVGSRTYTQIMREQQLRGEETEVSSFILIALIIIFKAPQAAEQSSNLTLNL